MSGASLCTRHTYRVPRTDVRQHRNSIQPLAFYIFCCYVGAPRPKPSQTFVYKSLTKNFCFAPSKLFSQTTRLCAVGEKRAGSACRVPRAETKAFQQAKARNSVQLQAGAVGEQRAGSTRTAQPSLSLTDLLFGLIENKVVQIPGRFKPRAAALRNLYIFPVFQARCLGFGIFFQEYLLLCKKVLPYSMQRKEQIYLVLHFYFKFNAHLSAPLRCVRLPDGGSDTGFVCCSTAAAAPDGSGRSDKI